MSSSTHFGSLLLLLAVIGCVMSSLDRALEDHDPLHKPVDNPPPGNSSTRYLRQVCFRQSDCPRHAACFSGNCECHMGFTWNDNLTDCSLLSCRTDNECLTWPDATCKNSECICSWGDYLCDEQTTCCNSHSIISGLTVCAIFLFLLGVLISGSVVFDNYLEQVTKEEQGGQEATTKMDEKNESSTKESSTGSKNVKSPKGSLEKIKIRFSPTF